MGHTDRQTDRQTNGHHADSLPLPLWTRPLQLSKKKSQTRIDHQNQTTKQNVYLTWCRPMMVKAGCCCCWLTSDVVLSFIVASVITAAARVLSSSVANYTLQQLKQRYLTTTTSQWRVDYFLVDVFVHNNLWHARKPATHQFVCSS